MPRPTRPQFIYGFATVVLSTLAMLLLSEARSTGAVLAIVVAGLTLGVLVAVLAATPLSARAWAARARPQSRVPAAPPALSGVPRSHVRAASTVAEQPREHSLQR